MNSRQIRLLGICAVLVLLVLYYVSNGAKNTRQSAFYLNTLSVLNSKQGHSSGGGGENKIDLDSPEEKLKIENYKKAMRELALQFDPAGEDGARADVYREQLKKQQTEQAPLAPDALGIPKSEGDAPPPPAPAPDAKEPALPPPVADSAPADPIPAEQEKSVAGRKKMKGDKIIPGRPGVTDESVDKSGNIGSPSRGDSDAQTAEADDAHKIETELNDILKRSPLVVFSKSYCPYSRKAKHILQDLYTITPSPHVVELDLHELGPGLQGALHDRTGRRTVPNVLVDGQSIGGGDDIEALHQSGKLIEKIQSLAGKQITSITTREPAAAAAAAPGGHGAARAI